MNPADNRVYYGWYIVAVAFFANFMAVGTGFYALNAFMEPLCKLHGWTRTDINLAMVIGTLFGFTGQFIYGTILIRTGVRPLMMIGSLVSGMAFIFMARVEHLWQFYLFYTLLFIGNGAYGGIVAATAVNNWFVKKRGKALGFATAGISFSGAILPLLAMLAIIHSGIENAALYIGLLVMLTSPLAWKIVREWPEDNGLLPDGDKAPAAAECDPKSCHILTAGAPGYSRAENWSLSALARTGTFWKIGLSFAMLMIGTVGVMSQLKPRFSDLGFSSMNAMAMMAATALVGALGKYAWGMFCDRFNPIKVARVLALANAGGLSLSLYHDSLPAIFLFIAVFGFTMGGIQSTYPVMVASLYGREGFPAALRYVSIFLMLQLSGYLIAGQSYDQTGSYDPAYMLFIGLDIGAAILLATVKRQDMPA